MAYNIKLEVFEGPFDLLFHLIEKSKVDIYNIPIADITKQYIEYLEQMKKFDLEIASEFLVMAATLLEIKSKTLLPIEREKQLQLEMIEEDPRKDLVKRLIEYKKYKNVAQKLKSRQEDYTKIFYKPSEQLDSFIQNDQEQLKDLDIKILLNAFKDLLKKHKKHQDHTPSFQVIHREQISIEDQMQSIQTVLKENKCVTFNQLFIKAYTKTQMVVTFLALLELIKLKFLTVQQTENFGEIIVQKSE